MAPASADLPLPADLPNPEDAVAGARGDLIGTDEGHRVDPEGMPQTGRFATGDDVPDPQAAILLGTGQLAVVGCECQSENPVRMPFEPGE